VATTVQDMLGDFEAAIQRLRDADDTTEERRALNEAINCLYMLRSHFEGKTKQEKDAYYATADASTDGRVSEGLSLLRGRMVHDFTSPLTPKATPLVPGKHLYTSPDLLTGENLSWLRGDSDVEDELVDKTRSSYKYDVVRFSYYKPLVGGHPVLQSLGQALDFFKSLA